ncbi:MAG: hypothetical protein ACREHE_12165 [Rhizomicrobium sp.]
MIRALLILTAAVTLSACGMVVSKAPVFPDRMAAADASLEGLYTLRGATKGDVAVVTRNDTHYTATFYERNNSSDPNAALYLQSGAADFQLIPLVGGDYAVQATCAFAWTGAGLFGKRDDGAAYGYQYAVLVAARPQQDFWIGISPGGAGLEKYHDAKKDIVDLSGVDEQAALPLFREWRDGLVQAGGDALTPIVRLPGQSWVTPAPDDPNPKSCRVLEDQSLHNMEKSKNEAK